MTLSAILKGKPRRVLSVVSDWKWQQIWSKKNGNLKVSFWDIYMSFLKISIHDFLNIRNCLVYFKHVSLFYCIFTCNKCEICCWGNHSALLHCEYRVRILTVMRGPRHIYNILTKSVHKRNQKLTFMSSLIFDVIVLYFSDFHKALTGWWALASLSFACLWICLILLTFSPKWSRILLSDINIYLISMQHVNMITDKVTWELFSPN